MLLSVVFCRKIFLYISLKRSIADVIPHCYPFASKVDRDYLNAFIQYSVRFNAKYSELSLPMCYNMLYTMYLLFPCFINVKFCLNIKHFFICTIFSIQICMCSVLNNCSVLKNCNLVGKLHSRQSMCD